MRMNAVRVAVSIVVFSAVASWADTSNITLIQHDAAVYDPSASAEGIARQFFRNHSDSYDFLIVFPTLSTSFGDLSAHEVIGFHQTVRTVEGGIGQQTFDHGTFFGSQARLKGYIDIGSLIPGKELAVSDALSVLAHEVAHQWSGKVRFKDANGQLSNDLIGAQGAHWSFFLNSEASVLYGSEWDASGPQSYRSIQDKRYSALDLYLMGFIGPESVPPLKLLRPIGQSTYQATDIPPPDGTQISATAQSVTIDSIVAAEGIRTPAANASQKVFRAAFVVLTAPGQQPTPAQLAHVEAVRSQWTNEFFFLTRGTAVMETDLVELAPPGATQHPSVQAAVEYLLQAQRTNGSWADDPRTAWRDTSAVAEALSGFRTDPRVASARQLALGFEDSSAPTDVDSVSRRLRGIRNLDASRQFPAAAVTSRSSADGLGLSWGYASGVQDTALALLVQSYVQPTYVSSRDWVWLKSVQTQSGAWPFWPSSSPRIEPTCRVLEALSSLSDRGPAEDAIAMNALSYLRTKRFPSGAFSDEDLESPTATALSIQALASWNRLTSPEATGARDFLTSQQSADGSWSHRSYDTATCISALTTILVPNLAVSALVVSRSAVVAGGDSTATVTIRNTSAVQADATVVQAFGLDGVVMSQRVVVPTIASGKQVSLLVPLDTAAAAGTVQLFIVVDPDNSDTETRRDDNRATTALSVQAPTQLPDLYVVEGSVIAAPGSISRVPETFVVTVGIGNSGLGAVGDVIVSVVANGTVVGSAHVASAPQSIQMISIPTVLSASSQTTLVVAVDLENAVTEAVESNNSTSLVLPMTPVVAVALESVTASPTAVTQGNDVTLSMVVRNEGTSLAKGGQLKIDVVDSGGAVIQSFPSIAVDVEVGTTVNRTAVWRAKTVGTFTLLAHLTMPSDDSPGNDVGSAVVSVTASPLANLTVSALDVTVTPSPILAGQPAHVDARVRNEGNAAAGAFDVVIRNLTSGVELGRRAVTSLAGGAVATFSADFTPTTGEAFQIVWQVDTGNTVSEYDESDNTVVVPVSPIGLADLSVTSAQIVIDPAFPQANLATTVRVTVTNVGGQASGAANLDLFLNDSAGAVIGSSALSALAAGGSTTQSFPWTAPSAAGQVRVVAVVNQTRAFMEESWTNNQAARTLTVQDGSFALTEPYFSPNGDGVKDTTDIQFRVAQPGSAMVTVADKSGAVVWAATAPTSTMTGVVTWNGRSDGGTIVDDGKYTVVVSNETGAIGRAEVVVDTNRSQIVDAVGTPYLVTSSLNRGVTVARSVPRGIRFGMHRNDLVFQTTYLPTGELLFVGPLPQGGCALYVEDAFGGAPERISRDDFECSSGLKGDPSEVDWPYAIASMAGGKMVAILRGMGGAPSELPTFGVEVLDLSSGVTTQLSPQFVIRMPQYQSTSLSSYVPAMTRAAVLSVVDGDPVRIVAFNGQGSDGYLETSYNIFYGDGYSLAPDTVEYTFPSGLIRANPVPPLPFTRCPEEASHCSVSERQHLIGDMIPLAGGGTAWTAWGGIGYSNLSAVPVVIQEPGKIVDYVDDPFGSFYGTVPSVNDDLRHLIASGRPIWGRRLVDLGNGLIGYEGMDSASCGVGCSTLVPGISVADSRGVARRLFVAPFADVYQFTNYANMGASSDRRTLAFAYSPGLAIVSPPLSNANDATAVAPIQDIRLLDVGSGASVRLATSSTGAYNIQWAPDGTSISFGTEVAATLANLAVSLTAFRGVGQSTLTIQGTAQDLNFDSYSVTARGLSSTDEPITIAGGTAPVVNGQLGTWTPPASGLYELRLVVVDKAGNTKTRKTSVSWGASPPLTNVLLSDAFISPNGDGVKDGATVSYTASGALSATFQIKDATGNQVRQYASTQLQGGNYFITWDGRNESGTVVPDGHYSISVESYSLPIAVDTVPPSVSLVKLADPRLVSLQTIDTKEGKLRAYEGLVGRAKYQATDENLDRWSLRATNSATGTETEIASPDDNSLDGTFLASDMQGRSFALSATDRAGNASRSDSVRFAEVVVLAALGDAAAIDPSNGGLIVGGRQVPRIDLLDPALDSKGQDRNFSFIPRLWAFSLASTNSSPLVSYAVAWRASGSTAPFNVDVAAAEDRGENLIVWDARGIPTQPLDVEIRAQDALGKQFIIPVRLNHVSRPAKLDPCMDGTAFGGLELHLSLPVVGGESPEFEPGAVVDVLPRGSLTPALEAELPTSAVTFGGTATWSVGAPSISGRTQCLYTLDLRGLLRSGESVTGKAEIDACALSSSRITLEGDQFEFALHESLSSPLLGVDTLTRPLGGTWSVVDSRGGFTADTVQALPVASLGGCGTFEIRWVGHQANGLDVDSVHTDPNICLPLNVVEVPCAQVLVSALPPPPIVDCQMQSAPASVAIAATTGGTSTLASMNAWLETPGGAVVAPLSVVGFTPGGQAASAQVNVDFSGVSDGAYVVAAEILDSNGFHTQGRGPKPPLVADRVAPAVSLGALPAHVCARQGTMVVSGTVSDQELTGYALSLSKGPFAPQSVKTFGPTAVVLSGPLGLVNLSGLESGDYLAQLSGRDGFGNSGCTAPQPVHVEADVRVSPFTVLPAAISPDGDGVVDAATAVFSVSEPSSVQLDLLRGDGSLAAALASQSASPQAQYAVPLPISGQLDGTYSVRVTATTQCGSTTAPSLGLVIDTQAPVATILQPIEAADAFGTVAVTGVATDPNFLDYEVALGQGTAPTSFTPVVTGTSAPGQILGSIDTRALAPGPYVIRLMVRDQVGHSSKATRDINVVNAKLLSSFHVQDPAISPNGDGKLDETVATGTLEASARLLIEVVGGAGTLATVADIAGAAAGPFSYPINASVVSGIPDGTYQLRATASNGPFSETASATLEIDRTGPVLAISQPTDGAFVRPGTEVRVNVTGASAWTLTLNQLSASSVMRQAVGDYAGVAGLLSDEGPLELVLHATDRAGNVSDLHRGATVDSISPVLSLAQPSDGAFVGGVVPLSGAVSDTNFAALELAWVRGATRTVIATLQSPPADGKFGDWDTTALADGPVALEARASDKAGNISVAHAALTVDNTPPLVSLTEPNGVVARADYAYYGQVSDQNLAGWSVELGAPPPGDPSTYTQVLTGTGTVTDWFGPASSVPPNGRYRVRVRATDLAGNTAIDEHVITIQDQPSNPPFVAPPTGLTATLVGSSTASLAWVASVSPGVVSYLVRRNGVGIATVSAASFQDIQLSDGSYSYDVIAVLQDLTQSGPSTQASLKVDTSRPQVAVTSPASGSRVGGVRQILGTATGGANFVGYEIGLGTGATPVSYRTFVTSAAPVSQGALGALDTSSLTEGALYTLRLTASSVFGGSVANTTQFSVDNTAPDAPVLTSLTSVGSQVTVAWQPSMAADVQGYLVLRDEQIANAPTGSSVSDFSAWLLPASATSYQETVKDGTHVYVVLAVDQAQNLSARSNSRAVTIETRAPSALIVSPDAGSLVTVPAQLVVSLSDEDVASVRFEAKPSGATVFTAFDTVSSPPFVGLLEPARFGTTSVDVRAVATDLSGHVDASPVSNRYSLEEPLAPLKLVARLDGSSVHASWQSPASRSVDHFELTAPSVSLTLAPTATSADFPLYGSGGNTVTLRAVSHFGQSESESVVVSPYRPGFDALVSPHVSQMPVALSGSGANAGDEIDLTRVDTGAALGMAFADSSGRFSESLTYTVGGFQVQGVAVDAAGNRSLPFYTWVPYFQTASSVVATLVLSSLVNGQPTFSVAISGDASPVQSIALWRRDSLGALKLVTSVYGPATSLVDWAASYGASWYFARLSGNSMLDVDSNVLLLDNTTPGLTLSLVADGNGAHVALQADVVNAEGLNGVSLMRRPVGEVAVAIARWSPASQAVVDNSPLVGSVEYYLSGTGASSLETVTSNTVAVTRAPAFGPPTELVANLDPATQHVVLSWTNANPVSYFEVQRSPDQSPRAFATIANTAALTVTDTPGSGSFVYRVRGRSGSSIGAYSAEALVHVPMAAPLLTSPDAGAITSSASVVVRGLANGAGTVQVLREHAAIVGSATASAASTALVPLPLPASLETDGEAPSLSPDGKWLAYASASDSFQTLYVRNVCDPSAATPCVLNETQVVGTTFHGPYVFSPDGTNIAGITTDPYSGASRFFFVSLGSGYPYAQLPLGGTQTGPLAWSRDSKSVAFVDQDANQVQAYRLVSDPWNPALQSLRQLSSETVNEIVWGSNYVYGIVAASSAPVTSRNLERWTRGQQVGQIVQTANDISELGFGGNVLVAAQFDGYSWQGFRINDNDFYGSTINFSTQTQPLIAIDSTGSRFILVANGMVQVKSLSTFYWTSWGYYSFDPTAIRGFSWSDSENPVMWLAGIQGTAGAPQEMLFGYPFQVSVGLVNGDNVLSSRSVAADGTIGLESQARTVTSTAASLDLAVTASLLPEMPTPSSVVSVAVVITNLGGVESAPFDLRVSIVSPEGGSRTVSGHVTAAIGSSASTQLFIPVDVSGLSGDQTLIVTVDPLQVLPDTDRSNNTFSKAFTVAPSPLPSASLATTRAGDSLSATVTVFNPGATASITTRVQVESQAGAPAVGSADDVTSMAAASTRQFARTFDLSSLGTGSYVLAAEVYVNGTQVSRTTEDLTVTRAATATVSLVATRTAFGPADAIGLEAFVLNTSASELLQGAALDLVVRDGTAAELVAQSVSVPVVGAGNSTTQAISFPAKTLPPGTYTATVTLSVGANVLSSDAASFLVDGAPQLAGVISISITNATGSPQTIRQGQPIQLAYTLNNLGTATAATSEVSASLIDVSTGTVVDVQNQPSGDLAPAGSTSGTLTFSVPLQLKTYALAFAARSNGSAFAILATTTVQVLDGVPPDIQIVGLTQDGLVKSPLLVRLRATDATGVALVRVSVDGTAPQLLSLTNGSVVVGDWDATLTLVPDGFHVLSFSAVDLDGQDGLLAPNSSNPSNRRVIVDTTPPVVAVSGVADGGRYGSVVSPTFSATDSNGVTVKARLDGVDYDSGAPIGDGVHTLMVTATDGASNVVTWTATFTVDTQPPIIVINGVTEGGTVPPPAVLAYQVFDTTPTLVDASIDGASFTDATTVTTLGSHTVSVHAVDSVGHESTVVTHFTVGTQGLAITIAGVVDGAFSKGPVTPVVSFIGAASSSITLNGQPFNSGAAVSGDGAYVLIATATSVAGESTTQTVHFTIDRTPPVLTLSGVADQAAVASAVTLTFTSQDANPLRLAGTLDGQAIASGASVSTDGTHVWTVEADDRAGNVATETRTFLIDRVAPVIAIAGVHEGQVSSTPLSPTVTVTEANPGTMSITLDTVPFASGASVSADGDHTLVVDVTDRAGNHAASTVHFSIDTKAPTLTLAGVADGAQVNHPVMLIFSAVDPHLDTVSSTVDGTVIASGDTISSEGTHVWHTEAHDTAGNSVSADRTFVIDLTPPSISVAGVLDGEMTNQNVVPVATVTGAAQVLMLLDAVPVGNGASISAEGPHVLEVDAADAAGNLASVVIHFTIDKTPPSVSMSGISDGATVAGPVTLNFGAVDAFLTHVQSTLDGHVIASGAAVAAEGPHVWVVDASDAAGNQTHQLVRFTIDSTRPVIAIAGATQGAVVATDVTLTITVTDATLAQTTITLDGVPFTSGDIVGTEGAHALHVSAGDRAGNTATADLSFTIDKTKPVLVLSGVADGQVLNHAVTLTFSATDAHLTSVTSTLDGALISSGAAVSSSGAHVWVVRAADGAGNTATETRSFTIDTQPPVITITGVTDGQLSRVALTPVVSISDATTSSIKLNGAAFVSGTPVSTDGAYSLDVTASDAAGNSASAHVAFSIDTTAPVLTMAGVLEGAIVHGPVTLTFVATDASAVTFTATLDGAAVGTGVVVSAEGAHQLALTARDAAGNQATLQRNFIIDTTPPVIVITGVTGGQSGTTPVTPGFSATDAHLSTVSASLNGGAFASGSVISLAGSYTLIVTAVDAAGNSASQTEVFAIVSSGNVSCRSPRLTAVRAYQPRVATYDAFATPQPTLRFALPGAVSVDSNNEEWDWFSRGGALVESALSFGQGASSTVCTYRGTSSTLSLVACVPATSAGAVVSADWLRLSVTKGPGGPRSTYVSVTLAEQEPCRGAVLEPTFNYAACGLRNVVVSQAARVVGSLAANVDATLSGEVEVWGDVVAGHNFTRSSHADLDGEAYYGGTASLSCESGCRRGECPEAHHIVPPPMPCECGYELSARLAEVALNNDNNLLLADPAVAPLFTGGALRIRNSEIRLAGGRYSLSSLTMNGGAIDVAPDDVVELFVSGNVDIRPPARLASWRGGRLVIVSGAKAASGGTVSIRPLEAANLQVYAPEADVTLDGTVDVEGAIVGRDVNVMGYSELRLAPGRQVSPPPLTCQ